MYFSFLFLQLVSRTLNYVSCKGMPFFDFGSKKEQTFSENSKENSIKMQKFLLFKII